MDAVHWKKIQRVTPWLINKEPVPEREYIVPHENMVDVTQSMACIQCGACVSDCLSMEVDPLFVGPAALAKAYRFVGDPRDARARRAPEGPRRGPARHLRLHALLQVHRGLPQGRRADEPDHAPAPAAGADLPHRRPQQRRPPRARVRQEHPQVRPPARGRPAAATPTAAMVRQSAAGGARAARLAAGDHQGAPAPQGHAGQGAAQRPQGRPRTSRRSTSTSRAATSATSSTSTSPATTRTRGRRTARAPRRGRAGGAGGQTAPRPASPARPRGVPHTMKVAYWPGCVSRGFTPELHGSMAQDRPAAGHRAGRARPRELLRRRRHRRAQPGARRHAERAHVRARPAGRGHRPDDEHLLDLPGRADRVPGAPGRQRRVPRAHQRDPAGRVGPEPTRRAS